MTTCDDTRGGFVSARHKKVHYGRIAAGIRLFLNAPDVHVLDFGCGEALSAARLAGHCGRLFLCDASPKVRDGLKVRYGGHPKIEVTSPEEVEAMADGRFCLIFVHGLLQRLSRAELARMLGLWRRLLQNGGSLVLADVACPHMDPRGDLGAFLGFALKEGFFLAALADRLRCVFPPRRGAAAGGGISTYEESEILALLEAARLPATRVRPNLSFNQDLMTFQAFRLR